jgi:hypothetical protein
MTELWLCLTCSNTAALDEHAHCSFCGSDKLMWSGVTSSVDHYYHGEEALNGVGRKTSLPSRAAKFIFGFIGRWILRIRNWEEVRDVDANKDLQMVQADSVLH